MDDELLQDFLVEAGELIENIDTRLVALENTPDDASILNEVFRAFHTIKGGAGFLNLDSLVAVCHRAEDVLNLIRGGQRHLDAHSTDLILQSVDEVKRMFEQVGAGETPEAAPRALLQALETLLNDDSAASAEGVAPVAPAVAASEPEPVAEAVVDAPLPAATSPAAEIDDFDALIDAIREGADPAAAAVAKSPVEAAEEAGAAPQETRSSVRDSAVPPTPATDGDRAPAATPTHPAGKAHGVEQSLRVDAARIDGVMNLVGELVLVRNRLTALRTAVHDEELNQALSRLDLVSSDLQTSVTRLRMQPVGKAFGRFPRVVRDLARQLGKQVVLEMHGEATELDKGMVECLADPLIHLVRNAIDHGIEMPADRTAAGKPAEGHLVMSAYQEGSHIFVIVSDDGKGLDPSVIKTKALDKGIIDSRTAVQMSDTEALQLIFMPGFSTRTEVSDLSGRGVGMDVVKSKINRVNGSVDIQSEKGVGTTILIRLPLTLAILPTLMVVVAGRRFALPLAMIEEIVDLDADSCSMLDGEAVVSLRGTILPLLDLQRWTGADEVAGGQFGNGFVVVTNTGERRVGLVVDQLIGQEDVIIKPLGARLESLPGFSGATITGDGGIALIIDPGSLHRSWRQVAVRGTPRFVT